MKPHLILTLFLLLSTKALFSQNYFPFIDESKSWRVVETVFLLDAKTTYYVRLFYFKGDTLINEQKYKTLWVKQEQPEEEPGQIASFLYEDTLQKKVYAYDKVYEKTILLYDFSLNPGDKFNRYIIDNLYTEQTVTKTDSIEISDNHHKRIFFDQSDIWIEGLGNVKHPFNNTGTELICILEDNQLLYLGENYNNCDTIFEQDANGIEELSSNDSYKFTIKPNPITSESVLESSTDSQEKFYLEIYTSSGILIKKKSFTKSYPIGSLKLEAGIYFIVIMNDNELIESGKFMVR